MNWFELAEDVLILKGEGVPSAHTIRFSSMEGILDVIETEDELAIQHSLSDVEELIRKIEKLNYKKEKHEAVVFEIPVCYELGLDWEEVVAKTKLSKSEIMDIHLETEYSARYGFLPGFLYLSGLDERLECPRKSNPRKQIPAGSIGIGRDKTGIYSLESPGGWQIIGRTPLALFDVRKSAPFSVPNGAKVRFKSISKQQFDDWN